MPLAVRPLLPALLLALLAAAPAQARPVSVGSHTYQPFTTCGNKVKCTATGQPLPVSGRLTTVRIGHAQLPSGGATTIKLKLFRQESNGNLVLVRDLDGGAAKSVPSGTTVTEWTGLSEAVTEGQVLGFFVDNASESTSLVMFASSGGSSLTLWNGEVNTNTGDAAHTWPPPAIWTGAGVNLSAIIRTPPITTIDSGPSGFTQNGSPSFTYSADETVTFQCSLDGAAYSTCPADGYTASGLSDGAHSFSVRGVNDIDQTGAPATRTFTVDRVAPDTSIASGPNGVETSDPRPTFTFASTEDGTFECKLDGGAFLACPTPSQPASELADGQHTLQVRSIDQAGNVDATPAVATFTVKRPPPPAPPAWGIPFEGQTWTFSDPVDSLGGPATDIESVRVVYDAAGGKFGALVRFHGSGARRFWLDLHRTPACTDYAKELWVSHMGDDNTIWAVASMNGVEFVKTRTSGDGREVLITIEDPRIAGLALRCLSMRSMAGSDTVDTLATSLVTRKVVIFLPPREEVIVILRQSLAPVIRVLQRRTPQQLARKRTHTLSVAAPGPGSVGVEWTVPAKVAKRYGVRVRRGVKKVTLAVGAKRTTKAAKKVKVKVKVSTAGRKVLRKAKKLKMQVRTGYLAQGGDQLLAATKSVQLGGKKKR